MCTVELGTNLQDVIKALKMTSSRETVTFFSNIKRFQRMIKRNIIFYKEFKMDMGVMMLLLTNIKFQETDPCYCFFIQGS